MSRIRANTITNQNANGAPNFPNGLTVTGIVTASTSASSLSQIVVGSAVTANSQGIDVTGVTTSTNVSVASSVTATTFYGSGANLTGIDATALKDSAGNVKVQANSHGAVTTGVHTATSFSGSGANLTGISAISMIDSWRISQGTGTGNNQIVTNWVSATNLLSSNLGSALTYSSGTFSFPSTGHYLMIFVCRFHCASGNDGEMNAVLKITENNSSYTTAGLTGYGAQEGGTKSAGSITYAFDITDTSNQKFQFHTDSMGSTSQLTGDSSRNETYFQMIRLADT